MNIAVLASGGLGLDVLGRLEQTDHKIQAVLTDKGSEAIQTYSKEKSFPLFVGNPRKGATASFIADKSIDVLVSVNYLFLIEPDLIEWPNKMAFNIHGSLLPKYRGRTPHVWAIINNEIETGITAHIIDHNCDTGGVLQQVSIAIDPDDTGARVLQKYRDQYSSLIEGVLENIAKGNHEVTVQDETKATYFGKRTPADGEIDWKWQRERIRNWVRAQAHPYPGAFTFLKGEKVIIDQVGIDDWGFSSDTPNGSILTKEPLRVKTPNGALRILKHRNSEELFSVNSIFD